MLGNEQAVFKISYQRNAGIVFNVIKPRCVFICKININCFQSAFLWVVNDLFHFSSPVFDLAKKEGLAYQFKSIDMEDAHPNSVQIFLWGETKKTQVTGASLGGGEIEINSVQGRKVNFNGDYATLLIFGKNQPGTTNDVTGTFVDNKINIAYLRVERLRRKNDAIMVFETDDPIPPRGIKAIRALPWVEWVCQIDKINR